MTPVKDNRLLTTREAAKLLRMKPSTLDAWRFRNQGPTWVVVGTRSIRYRYSALAEFIRIGEVEIGKSKENLGLYGYSPNDI